MKTKPFCYLSKNLTIFKKKLFRCSPNERQAANWVLRSTHMGTAMSVSALVIHDLTYLCTIDNFIG